MEPLVSGSRRDGNRGIGLLMAVEVMTVTAIQNYPPVIIRAYKYSSAWLPDGVGSKAGSGTNNVDDSSVYGDVSSYEAKAFPWG